MPSYLNLKCANKILFTGELLQLFQAKYLNEIFFSGDIETTASNNSDSNITKQQFVSDFDKGKK